MLIAQLSDLHVRPAGELYKGVADSNRMLREAIDHLLALDQRPDLVLLSGDLVDEGQPQEYANAVELLRALTIIRSFSNIEAVLCGHVHRSMIRRWAGTVVIACPSTTTEIALQLHVDAPSQSYLAPPACMLHLWDPAQGLVSHLSHIGQFAGPFPFA